MSELCISRMCALVERSCSTLVGGRVQSEVTAFVHSSTVNCVSKSKLMLGMTVSLQSKATHGVQQ